MFCVSRINESYKCVQYIRGALTSEPGSLSVLTELIAFETLGAVQCSPEFGRPHDACVCHWSVIGPKVRGSELFEEEETIGDLRQQCGLL